jgi:capsular exopolysaccharide synthesis family protein
MNNQFHNPSQSSETSDLTFDFGKYYHLFLRNLWVVVVVTSVIVLATAAWVMRQPKIYASHALLQVEQEEQNVVNMQDVQSEKLDSDDYLKTIEGAIQNRTVLLNVVNLAKLRDDPNFAPKGPKAYSDDELVTMMNEKVDAKLKRGSRLIEVTVEDQSAVKAQTLTEMLVSEFLHEYFDQRFGLSQMANDYLVQQSGTLKAKLEQAEMKLQEYKEKYNAVSLEDSQNITIEKLKDLNSKVTDAKSNRLRLEADIEQLGKLAANDYDDIMQIGSVSSLPDIQSLRDRVNAAQSDFATLQKRYLPKHPKYIEAASQLQEAQDSLRIALKNVGEVLRQQYTSALDTEKKLEQSLSEQEKKALELNKLAIPYNVLVREVDSDRAAYDAVISRAQQTKITEGVEKSPFRIIEQPMISSKPVKPKKALTLIAALVFGLGFSIALIIAQDVMNPSLRSVDQAEQFLGLPCLSAVPKIDRKTLTENPDEKLPVRPLVLASSSHSMTAESYRTLRASLSLLGEASTRRIFLFTSAVPSEGKSLTALNASLAFALDGLKTILIDADLRLPAIQPSLTGSSEPLAGLTDLLSQNSKLDEVVHASRHENLSFIPAGHRAPNPAELLGGQGFAKLIEDLSASYDRIVIDSAPINAVSDTLRIASVANFVCLIVRAGKTDKKAITRAIRLLRNAGARIAGFVLNQTTFGRTGGYYYYYYGDKYSKESAYGAAPARATS